MFKVQKGRSVKFGRTVISLTALSVLFAASFWIPWEGDWVDQAASMVLNRTLGLSVRCQNVKVHAWSKLSFDSIEVAFADQELAIRSGPGTVRFSGWGLLLKGSPLPVAIELRRVSLSESLFRRIPFLSLQAPDAGLVAGHASIVIDHLRAYVLQKKKWIVAHLLELTSKEIEARGGIQYDPHQKIQKAHVVLFFPKGIIPSQEGKGRLRFIFSGQTLTVIGIHGPLLKAQWG